MSDNLLASHVVKVYPNCQLLDTFSFLLVAVVFVENSDSQTEGFFVVRNTYLTLLLQYRGHCQLRRVFRIGIEFRILPDREKRQLQTSFLSLEAEM